MISSASSLEAPSLIGFGAASTKSLASFNPKEVTPLTSLITFILESPAAANITSKLSLASVASAPPGAAAPGATATAAAADTPHFSSRS